MSRLGAAFTDSTMLVYARASDAIQTPEGSREDGPRQRSGRNAAERSRARHALAETLIKGLARHLGAATESWAKYVHKPVEAT